MAKKVTVKVGDKVLVYDSRLENYQGLGTITELDPNSTNKNTVLVEGVEVKRTDEFRTFLQIVVHKNQCYLVR